MKLDRVQVARRQLGTALELFIDDLDPVSVHTLACAGGEVAEHLTRKSGAEPFTSHVLATFLHSSTQSLAAGKKGLTTNCLTVSTIFKTTMLCLSAGTTTSWQCT